MAVRESSKILDLIKPFGGSKKEEEIDNWILKFELVIKTRNLKNEECLLPLLLEKEALAVFLELSDEDKKSGERIKSKLRTVFGENPFYAFGKLVSLKWAGEPVDVFLAEIRRLARAANVHHELVVKRTFVNGFPKSIGISLRSSPDIEECRVEDIVARARVLTECWQTSSGGSIVAKRSSIFSGVNIRNSLKCFECDGPHLKRNCPRMLVTCFKCGMKGHMAGSCRINYQGNGMQKDVVPKTSF